MNKAMRVHDYLAHIVSAIERIERHIDFEMVWRTVCYDLPDLYRSIKRLLP